MRYTKTREQVYEFLSEHARQSFNAYEIAAALTMNHVTVYRILSFLQKNKIVHYVPTLGKWILCHHQKSPNDHNFLICRECHSVEEYTTPHQCMNHLGFHCEEHIIEILGVCNSCFQK